MLHFAPAHDARRISHRGTRNERRRVAEIRGPVGAIRQIEGCFVSGDGDLDVNTGGFAARSPIVQVVLPFIDAVRQFADGLAHLDLRQIVQTRQRHGENIPAVLPAKLHDAPFASLGCRDLSKQIALARFGIPYIGLQKLHDRRIHACRCRNQNRGNAHRLLKGIDGLGEVAARPCPADIGPMRKADRECDDIAIDEDRPNHLDVVQMVAAERAKIIDQNVAVVQAADRQHFQQFRNGVCHRPEMDRNFPALTDQIALGIGDRRRQVAGFAQQWRTCRTRHHQAHFLGRRRQTVPDHLDGKRIELHGVTFVRKR